MIRLCFDIGFTKPWKGVDRTYFEYDESVSKNLALSIQLSKWDRVFTLIGFTFDWRIKTDHAGPYIEVSLFGFDLIINLYDKRHWDYQNDCWEKYDGA
jgi:hypothetical protein